ncbi:MAG: glycosyltransferase [Flavobacteriaceae bacterium]|nr:glycosyltransferase [Flavobacteriaceae bacterium]
MPNTKNVLVAPLNWGIGHATRCIPIIKELIEKGFNPIIGSDGIALDFLRKEFPKLKFVELPSYNIKYPKNGRWLKWKLLFQSFSIRKAITAEQELVESLVLSENLIGIISDNRMGVRSDKVPSVYITHQIKVYSGFTTYLTSKIHQYFINKFDECWVPDIEDGDRLSGKLSENKLKIKTKYLGISSRFQKNSIPIKYDLLVLLSGIEPLRTQLENKLISELKKYKGTVLFVRGVISEKQEKSNNGQLTFINFLLSKALETAINESKLVLCRSGYSTILDLAILNKKCFFIPTNGQNEQEYLAKHLKKLNIAPFSSEEKFTIEMLSQVENYRGFVQEASVSQNDLFNLF